MLLWLHRTCVNQAKGKPTCTVSHLQLGRYLMGAHAYLSGHAQAHAFSSHVLACQNKQKLIIIRKMMHSFWECPFGNTLLSFVSQRYTCPDHAVNSEWLYKDIHMLMLTCIHYSWHVTVSYPPQHLMPSALSSDKCTILHMVCHT